VFSEQPGSADNYVVVSVFCYLLFTQELGAAIGIDGMRSIGFNVLRLGAIEYIVGAVMDESCTCKGAAFCYVTRRIPFIAQASSSSSSAWSTLV
jgi:hypothetical protein